MPRLPLRSSHSRPRPRTRGITVVPGLRESVQSASIRLQRAGVIRGGLITTDIIGLIGRIGK